MASRVPADRLTAQIDSILAKYGEDVQGNLNEIVKEISKKGAQAIRSKARGSFDGTGKYAKGWTSKVETGRLFTVGTIYNKDLPGLPHLLEHGHANRGGGRTPGRVHISEDEQKLIKEFESKVRSRL